MAITAIGSFAPGVYTMTYDGNDVGMSTSEGYRLKYRPSHKRIEDTSIYGDTMIDGIYRGMRDVQLMTTFKEWNQYIRTLIWPYGAAQFDGTLGQIGILNTSLAKQIVLTAAANTPAAAANGPATFTAAKCLISADNNFDVLFGPDERNISVLFDLYLYRDSADSAGVTRFFSKT